MAVTANLLTTGGSASAVTSISTASVTPGANRLVAIYIVTDNGAPTSVTGNGLTWVQEILDTTLVPIAMWRSMGVSPSAGQITINLAANSVISWVVVEYDGVDTSGSNGSGAIKASQDSSTTGSAVTSLTITMPAAVTAGNATVAMFINGISQAMTAGSGYTVLGETTASGFCDQAHEWAATGTQTPSVSWASSANAAGLATEIVAAATATGPDPNQWLGAVFPATRGPVPATPSRFLQPWWDPSPPSAVEAHSGAATDTDRTSGTTAAIKSTIGAAQSGTRTSGVSAGVKGAAGASTGQQRTANATAAAKQTTGAAIGEQHTAAVLAAVHKATGASTGQQRSSGIQASTKRATGTAVGQAHSSGVSVFASAVVYATGVVTHAQASAGPVALSSASGATHHEPTNPTPATITAASGTVTHQTASSGEGQVN